MTKKNRFAEIDAALPEFTDREKELQKYFGVPIVSEDGKRLLTSVIWWTGKHGKVFPEMICPAHKTPSKVLFQELRYFFDRYAPVNKVNTDYARATNIARLLIQYYEKSLPPAKWHKRAAELVAKLRGDMGEYLWPKDPPLPSKDLLYVRYRPGWEDIK